MTEPLKKEILHSAIAYLSRREHSTKELIEKLERKDFYISDILPVIDYLQVENYQSDERFAESYIRHRINKGYGWQYIQNELSLRGVSREIISEQRKNSEIDWYLQAELAYNKRFSFRDINDQKDKAKRIRFLQYRGFSMDEIMHCIK